MPESGRYVIAPAKFKRQNITGGATSEVNILPVAAYPANQIVIKSSVACSVSDISDVLAEQQSIQRLLGTLQSQ